MGGNGSFASGINSPYDKYEEVGYIGGLKVLKGIQGHHKLPEESKTGNAYIILDDKNNVRRVRFYRKNHKALLDVEYHGEENLTGDRNKKVYHYHTYTKGKRSTAKLFTEKQLNKYIKYFEGVKYDKR